MCHIRALFYRYESDALFIDKPQRYLRIDRIQPKRCLADRQVFLAPTPLTTRATLPAPTPHIARGPST